MTESRFLNLIRRKNVVFITVKNKDYIRVTQIKRLLEKEASSFRIYSSEKSNPLTRALDLRKRLGSMDLDGADVVILGFLPQLIWGKLKNRLSNKVMVADFFLSMYDTVVLDRKLVRDGFFAANFLRKQDRAVLEDAALVLTDTRANADFLSSLYGVDKEKFEAMYLEADRSIYEDYKAKFSDKESIDCVVREIEALNSGKMQNLAPNRSDFKVLYFGTGLPLQGTDTVLYAFNEVAGEKLHCTYIGSLKGIRGSILRSARSNPGIELIKWLPQRELAERIAESDLCIAGHFNLYIDKAARTIPGKAYIYEAMGKPMILGDTKANHELFKEDDKHFFVKRGDAKALSDCIIMQAEKEGLVYGR